MKVIDGRGFFDRLIGLSGDSKIRMTGPRYIMEVNSEGEYRVIERFIRRHYCYVSDTERYDEGRNERARFVSKVKAQEFIKTLEKKDLEETQRKAVEASWRIA